MQDVLAVHLDPELLGFLENAAGQFPFFAVGQLMAPLGGQPIRTFVMGGGLFHALIFQEFSGFPSGW